MVVLPALSNPLTAAIAISAHLWSPRLAAFRKTYSMRILISLSLSLALRNIESILNVGVTAL
jgi:hypothetical protein